MDSKIMYETGVHYFEANVNNMSADDEGTLSNYRAKYTEVTEKAWVEDHNRRLCAKNNGACSQRRQPEMKEEIIKMLKNQNMRYEELAHIFGEAVWVDLFELVADKKIASVEVMGQEMFCSTYKGKRGRFI